MRVPPVPSLTIPALLCVGLALSAAPASAADAPRTVLDAVEPVDVSVQGQRVAWLRPASAPSRTGTVRTVQAVVLDAPGGTPRVLSAKLPDFADSVALGSDGNGRTVLTIGSRGRDVVVRADGSGPARRLRGQTSKDEATVMRAGRIAFLRTSRGTTTLRFATAAGRPSKLVRTVPREYQGLRLALGARDAIALHAYRPRDVGIGNIVWLMRPGKKVVRLTSQSTGGASDNGIGALTVSADGSRFAVTRFNIGGGHPSDVQRFSATSGKRVSVRPATAVPNVDALDEYVLDDGRSVVTPIETFNCARPGDPDAQPGAPACLGLDLVG
ncbi:hypothetical protein [Patulibacter sp.]|uniref:hypothetical protein n=1 Tax=Patulibacter sp. TaxID=1912859 RepID=UPI00272669D7|nr:hypothetical protein [Patulibacter sp.]MDO9409922.1 hypothetical protein [Patulibacter sp.]